MNKRLEILGTIATAVAVLGVLANNARMIWCFPCWVASNTMTLYLHARGGMWSLAVRDAIFLLLAVAGWWQWAN